MKLNSEPGMVRYKIFQRLEAKETDELLAIWKRHDRSKWSRRAFHFIHDILMERLGSVPPNKTNQGSPPEGEDPEADEPFHNRQVILTLASLARIASWFALAVGLGLIIVRMLSDVIELQAFPQSSLRSIDAFAIDFGTKVIEWGFDFILLRLISEGLYLFLDIEEGTRPTNRPSSPIPSDAQ